MKRGAAFALVMLWLEALLLVAGGLSTAAASDAGVDTIRLPSDGAGFADLVTAMTRATRGDEKEKRPWKCCDVAVCTRSWPPICRCVDKVEHCSDACKQCEDVDDTDQASSGRTCKDWYRGQPGPKCHEHDGGLPDLGVASSMAMEVVAAGRKNGDDGEKSKRPWKCCDLQICTRSQPPTCHCWDVVDRCSNACKRCEEVTDQDDDANTHARYRCLDAHRGDPGPRCGHHQTAAAGGMN